MRVRGEGNRHDLRTPFVESKDLLCPLRCGPRCGVLNSYCGKNDIFRIQAKDMPVRLPIRMVELSTKPTKGELMNGVMSFTRHAIVAVLFLGGADRAYAQVNSHAGTAPTNHPYQQTLSPYLDLLRSDSSTLSPYHSFVRPRQQVRQRLQYQSSQIQRFEREAYSTPSRSVSPRLPTGRGGSFNNYLHYYQSSPRVTRR